MFVEYLTSPKEYDDKVTGGDCDSVAPDGGYECTLKPRHLTPLHKAGVPGNRVVAEWDDDRTTD